MNRENSIISLYLEICEEYNNYLWMYCQRFSNNTDLTFTDEEVLTIFIFGIIEGMYTVK